MSYSKIYLKNNKKYLYILMNNQIISYILHFEIPNNYLVKDNIYFNNNYCEIIKRENTFATADRAKYRATNTSNKMLCNIISYSSPTALFHCFSRNLETTLTTTTCIKNNIYNFFTKQKNTYDDIIRL